MCYCQPISRITTSDSKISKSEQIQQTKEDIKYFKMGERCKEMEISTKVEIFRKMLEFCDNNAIVEYYEELFKDYLK